MALIRKVRKVGSSLVITIPSQIAELYEIYDGTELRVKPVERGKLILEKTG